MFIGGQEAFLNLTDWRKSMKFLLIRATKARVLLVLLVVVTVISVAFLSFKFLLSRLNFKFAEIYKLFIKSAKAKKCL